MDFCKKCLFFLFCIHFLFPIHSATFTSLDNIQQYADQLEEYPEADNITQLINWLDPSYKEFHKHNVPGLFDRIRTALWIKTPGWESKDFQDLLNDVVKQREQKGYKGRFIQKYVPDAEDQFILFGNVHGAFHSLVRDLQKLKQQGIINDSLKIIKNNYRIVFIGNVIDRSPFVLETFMLVMRLMFENPDKVFNIRGDHEDNQKWLNFSLRDELQLRISNHAHEDVPLQSLVDRLFNTLPLAIYLVQEQTEKNIDVVRISSDGLSSKELDERKYYCFFSPENENEVFDIGNGFSMQCRTRVNLKAVLHVKRWSLSAAHGEYWGPEIYPSGGLQFIGKHNGIAQWAIMSSPTNTGRRLFGFHFDSFVTLHTSGDINNWKLTVFNRDLIKDDNAFIEQTFFLVPKKDKPEFKSEVLLPIQRVVEKRPVEVPIIKEKPIEKEKVAKKGIVSVGSILPLTKQFKALGVIIKQVMDAVIGQINKEGGINGKKIDMTILDDEYTVEITKGKVKTLLQQNIHILLNPFGSPTLESYLDLVKKKELAVLFPLASARFPNTPYVVRFRVSVVDEGYLLAKYCVNQLSGKKIAIFYQNDVFGNAGLEGVIKYLKEKGMSDWLEVPFQSNLVAFEKQVNQIKTYKPDSIIFITGSISVKAFIRQIGVQFLADENLLGICDLSEESFKRFTKEMGLNFILSSIVPNAEYSQLEIVKEFRKDAVLLDFPINSFALETYIGLKIFVYLIEHIDGPINQDSVISAAQNIKNVDFKGLQLNYIRETGQLFNKLWLDTGKDEWESISLKEEIKETEQETPAEIKEEKKGTISVGSVLPLTKLFKPYGVAAKNVMDAVIGEINKEGGVNGRIIDMTILDDEYIAEVTKERIQSLLQQNIHILLNPYGSPTLESYLDSVRKKELAVLFPLASAVFPNAPYVVRFRVSVVDEGYLLAKYCVNQLSGKKIAIFYQNDVFGKSGLEGVIKYLKEKGISNWEEVPFQSESVAFEKQVNQIKTYKPDSIIFIASSISAKALIRQIGAKFLSGKNLLGNDDLSEQSFTRFTKEMGLNFVVSSVVPNAKHSQLKIVQEFRKDAEILDFPINSMALETYIGLKLFVYLIEQIDGQITQDSIISAAQNVKNVDFKGLNLNYVKKTGQLFDKVWLNTGKDEWEVISLKEEAEEPAEIREKPAVVEERPKKVEEKPQVAKEKPLEEVKPAEKIKEEDLGERQSVIKVGTTLALTKYLRDLGKSLDDGLKLGINQINKTCVDGPRIDLTTLDDYYVPSKAQENVQRLLSEYGTNIIISPLGSPTLEKYLDLVEQGKILVLFPSTGAPIFRKPDLKNIIHYRISFFNEAYELTKYFIEQLGLKKMAFFYQDDAYGRGPLEGARAALKDSGINDWIEIPYSRGQTDFEKEVKKIKEKSFEVLGLFSVAISSIEFIRQADIPTFMGKRLYGISPIGERTFTTFLKRHNLKIVLAYPFPNPETSDLEIAKEFRTLAKQQGISLSTYSLEGYINASLFGYLLSKVKGFITNEKIISAAESIKNYNFKGLELNFDPQLRQLSNTLWIDFGQKDWKKVTLGKQEK